MLSADDVILQSAATANGNGTAFDISVMGSIGFQVTGTFSATINFECSLDGTNWVSLQVEDVADGSVITSTTSVGVFRAGIGGISWVRARISGYASGSVTVRAFATEAGSEPSMAALVAGEAHVGEVGGSSVVVDLTLSLDTNVYASGDVLAEVQELTNALRVAGGSGIIHSLQVIDKDDQGQPLDVVFFDSNASLGTENAAVSISDADAATILGIAEVASGDYVDLANSQVASKNGLNIVVEVSSGTSLYVGAISRGTGTYTASGVVLRVGILQD